MEESEPQLQEYFINLLKNIGYEYVEIDDEDDLVSNFEKQLKIFNNTDDLDFKKILNYLYSGDKNSKFDKLRNSFNGIEFVDFSDFSSNIFQIAEEINMEGNYRNRYDVTILINGLPLVQIELKRSGVELIKAFNQIQRYSNQSYSRLFDLTQIYVISNKVNTKYFFNDLTLDYNFTYNWKDNNDLESFTNSFLLKNNLIQFLSDYIFKDLLDEKYVMLRDYQISALECVLDKIENKENAYLWFSSNTGGSLSSFRLAELLKDKFQVIYIVNDYLIGYPQDLIVNSKREFLKAIETDNFIVANVRSISLKEDELNLIKDKRFIFIFNDYEKYVPRYNPLRLINSFKNSYFYCFCKTPIFDENIIADETTKYIFSTRAFNYSFKDALEDGTNLVFNVDYVNDNKINSDYSLSSDLRIKNISNFISDNFDKYSFNSKFKSILIVSSNKDLIRYYEFLKTSDLKAVPILRHESNDIFESVPIREYFENYIGDYNQNFNADITLRKVVDSSKESYEFEVDVIKKFKNGEIDLLIVDEAIFDNPFRLNILGNLKTPLLNTVYLDCNLEYERLFEALTMANGIGYGQKHYANIVLFRDLRKNIDKAINLYSNNTASEETQFKDYKYYLDNYNQILLDISSSSNFMNDFNYLEYFYNILSKFEEFDFNKSQNDEFNYYKDKFEHEKFKINSNKKLITSFNPEILDHFSIDLNYLADDKSVSDEITKKEIIYGEVNNNTFNFDNSSEVNSNILSLKKIDNSKELNIVNNNQDLSKTVIVNNEYHIHIGGDNIKNLKNLDLKDLIQSETADKEELVKICPRCHKKYTEEYNYCSKHDELYYIHDLIKVCNSCKSTYPKEFNYCVRCDCDEPLTVDVKKIQTLPNKYYDFNEYSNNFVEIPQLLSQSNKDKLTEFNLSQIQFDTIISNIKNTYKAIFDYLINEYGIDLNTLTTLNKILLFSKSFVKTDYKEGGGDLGHFEFNEIHIDDRATDAIQITTIIHELSHFLMAEILEQIVSEILNTNKNEAVEAFVCYSLVNNNLNYLIDEYCAHTVEGRFAVLGYQDYGSYEKRLSLCMNEYTEEHIIIANTIGNTFAFYIKDIITSFIDDDLRNEIKGEFNKINDSPKYSGLKYETDAVLEWEGFSKAMKIMLTDPLKEFVNNPEDMEKLKQYAVKFKEMNRE